MSTWSSKGKALPKETGKKCPVDGAPMVLRTSRNGAFYGCSNYPRCKGTRDLLDQDQKGWDKIGEHPHDDDAPSDWGLD